MIVSTVRSVSSDSCVSVFPLSLYIAFREYPDVYSKVDDLPPAKYNVGANIKNSLVSSGSIINGTVENSVVFKNVYVGNNCVIKNSIVLNDVFIGDNTYLENCIVEAHDTIRANSRYVGEEEIKVLIEQFN